MYLNDSFTLNLNDNVSIFVLRLFDMYEMLNPQTCFDHGVFVEGFDHGVFIF